MITLLFSLVIFAPNFLGEPDNYIAANPLSTPAHIIPEWYFLFSYCALRSIPNKLGGVLALFCRLLILLILPLVYDRKMKGSAFYPLVSVFFWLLVSAFIMITFIGIAPVEAPFTFVGLASTLVYFTIFCVLSKVSSLLDRLM